MDLFIALFFIALAIGGFVGGAWACLFLAVVSIIGFILIDIGCTL